MPHTELGSGGTAVSKVRPAPGVVLPQPGGQRVLKNHTNMSVMKCIAAVKTGREHVRKDIPHVRKGLREALRSG